MKKQRQQKYEQAWCSQCKKITRFVTHVDYEIDKWMCTERGCFHNVRKLEQEPKKVYPSWESNTMRNIYL